MVSLKAVTALAALISATSAQYSNSSSESTSSLSSEASTFISSSSSLSEESSFIYSPSSSISSTSTSSSSSSSASATGTGISDVSAQDTYTGSTNSDSKYHWFTVSLNVNYDNSGTLSKRDDDDSLSFTLPDSFTGFPDGDIDVVQNGEIVGTLKHDGHDFTFEFTYQGTINTQVTFTALLSSDAMSEISSPGSVTYDFKATSNDFSQTIDFVARDLSTVGKNAGNNGKQVWWTVDIPASIYHGSFDLNTEADGYSFEPDLLTLEIVTALDAFNNASASTPASADDYVVNADESSIIISYTGSIDGDFLRVTFFAAPGSLIFWPNEVLVGITPASGLSKRDTVYELSDNYNIVAVSNLAASAGGVNVVSSSSIEGAGSTSAASGSTSSTSAASTTGTTTTSSSVTSGQVETITTTGSNGEPTSYTTTYGESTSSASSVTFVTTNSVGSKVTVTGEVITTTTVSNNEVITLTTTYCPLTAEEATQTSVPTITVTPEHGGSPFTFTTTGSNGKPTVIVGEEYTTTTVSEGRVVTLTTTYCPLAEAPKTVTVTPEHGGSAVTFTSTGLNGKPTVYVGEEYTTTTTLTEGNVVTLTTTYCPLTANEGYTETENLPTVTVAPKHGGSAVTFTSTGSNGKPTVYVGEEYTTTTTLTEGNVVTLTTTYCPLTANEGYTETENLPTVTVAPIHGGSAVTFTTTGSNGESTVYIGEEYTTTTVTKGSFIALTATYCPLTASPAETTGVPVTFTTTYANGETSVITGVIIESTSTGANGEVATVSSIYVPPTAESFIFSAQTLAATTSTGYVVVDVTTNSQSQSIYYTNTYSTPTSARSGSQTAVVVESSNGLASTYTTVIPIGAETTAVSESTAAAEGTTATEGATETTGAAATTAGETTVEASSAETSASTLSSDSTGTSSGTAGVSSYSASGNSLKVSTSFFAALGSIFFFLI